MIPRAQISWSVCACATLLLLTSSVPICRAIVHPPSAHHSASSSSSGTSSSVSVTSFTTSGPDSALGAPKTSKSTESPVKSNSTLPKATASTSVVVDDLTESQSAPVPSTHAHHSSPHYQHYHQQIQHSVQQQQASKTTPSASATLGGALGDLSPTASQPQAQAISTVTGSNTQFSVNQAQLQQQMAMMGAKPGAFTLVSNQQVGPGHVTMIGYTTPIIKVGGIVKHEQVMPGQMPRNAELRQAPSPQQAQQLSAQTHAALHQEPRASVSAVPLRSSESSSSAVAPGSSSQTSATMDAPVKMYYERPQISQIGAAALGIPSHPGFYGPEAGRALGITNYRMTQEGASLKAKSAALQQSPPTFIAGAGPNFDGVAVEKGPQSQQQQIPQLALSQPQKPFLVYKPGFLEKLKHHQAGFPSAGPQMMFPSSGGPMAPLSISQPQGFAQGSPLSPISMAFGGGGHPQGLMGPAKVQIEKHGHGLSNIVPIADLESNEIGGGPVAGAGFGDRVHHQFPPQTIPQLSGPQGGGPQGLSQHFGSARPISIAKQMTMDALAQQRSHILNAQLRGPSMLAMAQQQQQPQQQAQLQQQQGISQLVPPQFAPQQFAPPQSQPQFPSPAQFSAPPQFSAPSQFSAQPQFPNPAQPQKMFGRPMEMSQALLQSGPSPQQVQQLQQSQPQFSQPQFSQPQFGQSQFNFPGEQSAKLRFLPQDASPPPQPSRIQIPEPQVTSTISMPESKQNSDPRRELQEQINFVLQNSPNLSENSRRSHRSDIMKAVQESMADSDSSAARPAVAPPKSFAQSPPAATQFEAINPVDSLLPSSSPFGPSSSSYREGPEGAGYTTGKLMLDSPYMTSNYKSQSQALAAAASARHAPESSTYSRYAQESTMFLPQDSLVPQKGSPTTSAAASEASLNNGYKAKLQQEIQRYLQDQIDKSNAAPVNFITGPNGPVFTMTGNGAIQSPAHPMMKYSGSPLRKVLSMVEKSAAHSPHSQADNAPGHHFVLARQTEFIQPSSSQPSSATVKAPEGVTASASSSSPSSSGTSSESSQKSALASHYSSLMSQLAAAAASAGPVANLHPEATKTMRGYSEWWKESATAQSRPIVPFSSLYQAGIAQ